MNPKKTHTLIDKIEVSRLYIAFMYMFYVLYLLLCIVSVSYRCSARLCIICSALLWGGNWPLRSCLLYRLWRETPRHMAAMIKPWMHDQVNCLWHMGLTESLFGFDHGMASCTHVSSLCNRWDSRALERQAGHRQGNAGSHSPAGRLEGIPCQRDPYCSKTR